jgi:hypothetical protein
MPLIILIHVSVYYMLYGGITEPDTATQNYCAQRVCKVFSLQTAGYFYLVGTGALCEILFSCLSMGVQAFIFVIKMCIGYKNYLY